MDGQHALAVRDVHSLVWGGGYRATSDRTEETPVLFFEPSDRTTHLFNVFVQDEIRLGRKGWFATLGTKLEHNSYSGWELQPTGRVRLTRPRATVWGAISRAVRMPTRFDSDIRVTLGQPVVVITGSPAFEPEQLVAYEAGVRTQVASELAFDVSFYHDEYRRLRSQEAVPGAPITLGNTIQGHIDGIEFGATWEPADVLRIHGATTFLDKSLDRAPGSLDVSGGEGNDACCLARLQIFADLREDLRLTGLARYIAALPAPHLAAYAEADVTLQWDVRRGIELSLVGQNLLHDSHPEFTSGQPLLEAYERSFFVTITFQTLIETGDRLKPEATRSETVKLMASSGSQFTGSPVRRFSRLSRPSPPPPPGERPDAQLLHAHRTCRAAGLGPGSDGAVVRSAPRVLGRALDRRALIHPLPEGRHRSLDDRDLSQPARRGAGLRDDGCDAGARGVLFGRPPRRSRSAGEGRGDDRRRPHRDAGGDEMLILRDPWSLPLQLVKRAQPMLAR